jgi:colicin import membrane protein
MKHFKYSVSLMMVLALVLVFIGCSKPPEAEQKAAQAAMDAAVSAGADKYAAADLDAAKKVWEAAEAQVKEKKYKEAKQGYVDAKAAFEKAAGAVEAGKKAVVSEATAALAAVEEAWKGVEAAARKVEKKMKDKKDAWVADAKAFGDNLKAAKEMIAAEPTVAKAKAGEMKGVIEKWEAAFKELAAAPAKPEAKKKAKK